MKFSEINHLDIKELLKLKSESLRELKKLAIEAKTGQLRANHKIKNIKKVIARIETAITSKV